MQIYNIYFQKNKKNERGVPPIKKDSEGALSLGKEKIFVVLVARAVYQKKRSLLNSPASGNSLPPLYLGL